MSVASLLLLGRVQALALTLVLPAEPSLLANDLVLYLAPVERGSLDSRSLLEAVAIYTRDLHLRVQAVPDVPAASSAQARAHAGSVLRARGARVAFWCVPGPDGRSVRLFVLDAREALREDVMQGSSLNGPEPYRAIALKLRAMLVGEGKREAAPHERVAGAGTAAAAAQPAAAPEHLAPPEHLVALERGAAPALDNRAPRQPPARSGPAPGSTTPSVAVAGRLASNGPAAAPVLVPASANPPSRPPPSVAGVTSSDVAGASRGARYNWPAGVFAAAAYHVSIPAGELAVRQALAIHGIVGLEAPFEIDLGLELALATDHTIATGTVSLYDLPARLGGKWVQRGGRFVLGAGVFGAVHFMPARATSTDGRSERAFNVAGGLGGEAVVRGPSIGKFSGEARAWVEAVVPRTRFLVGGSPAAETSSVVIGLGLGVAFPTR